MLLLKQHKSFLVFFIMFFGVNTAFQAAADEINQQQNMTFINSAEDQSLESHEAMQQSSVLEEPRALPSEYKQPEPYNRQNSFMGGKLVIEENEPPVQEEEEEEEIQSGLEPTPSMRRTVRSINTQNDPDPKASESLLELLITIAGQPERWNSLIKYVNMVLQSPVELSPEFIKELNQTNKLNTLNNIPPNEKVHENDINNKKDKYDTNIKHMIIYLQNKANQNKTKQDNYETDILQSFIKLNESLKSNNEENQLKLLPEVNNPEIYKKELLNLENLKDNQLSKEYISYDISEKRHDITYNYTDIEKPPVIKEDTITKMEIEDIDYINETDFITESDIKKSNATEGERKILTEAEEILQTKINNDEKYLRDYESKYDDHNNQNSKFNSQDFIEELHRLNEMNRENIRNDYKSIKEYESKFYVKNKAYNTSDILNQTVDDITRHHLKRFDTNNNFKKHLYKLDDERTYQNELDEYNFKEENKDIMSKLENDDNFNTVSTEDLQSKLLKQETTEKPVEITKSRKDSFAFRRVTLGPEFDKTRARNAYIAVSVIAPTMRKYYKSQKDKMQETVDILEDELLNLKPWNHRDNLNHMQTLRTKWHLVDNNTENTKRNSPRD